MTSLGNLRKRCGGKDSVQILVDALKPHVVRRGPSFVKYNEGDDPDKAPIDRKRISQQHELLASIHDASPNLALDKVALEKALRTLYNELGKEWKLSDDGKLWVGTMSNRLRNMCRKVSCALRRKDLPSWAAELPWVREGENGGDDAQVEPGRASSSNENPEYLYGFDPTLSIAWRQLASSSKKNASLLQNFLSL